MQNIDVSQLTQQFPLLQSLIALEPVSWFNPKATTLVEGLPHVGLDGRDVADASARLARFAPICAKPSPRPAPARVLSNPTSPPSRRCCAP